MEGAGRASHTSLFAQLCRECRDLTARIAEGRVIEADVIGEPLAFCVTAELNCLPR